MGFKRVWDSSCPHVYDTWEADGKRWVIQDLPPEDDEEALEILVDHLGNDEPLCTQNRLMEDAESVDGMSETWRHCLAERTSLACYTIYPDGKRTLVALNCCNVGVKGNMDHPEVRGKAWKNVYAVVDYMEAKGNIFEHLGLDQVLLALGLVVKREYRGARLGARVLNAREPLCRLLGVGGTATVFTAVPSQKLADRCGFTTILESSWRDFADAGLDFPRDDDKTCKLMFKKYQ